MTPSCSLAHFAAAIVSNQIIWKQTKDFPHGSSVSIVALMAQLLRLLAMKMILTMPIALLWTSPLDNGTVGQAMLMISLKLLSCPFCGSDLIDLRADDSSAHVHCLNCKADGPEVERVFVDTVMMQRAIDEWNNRRGDGDE